MLRNVAARSVSDLWVGLDRLRADSIARSIPPEEVRGAIITLSNFGMIGGRFANLVYRSTAGGNHRSGTDFPAGCGGGERPLFPTPAEIAISSASVRMRLGRLSLIRRPKC